MDFERILKTHYFLFTSSSSLCELAAVIWSHCQPTLPNIRIGLSPKSKNGSKKNIVLALENVLKQPCLTRELGDDPCFLY